MSRIILTFPKKSRKFVVLRLLIFFNRLEYPINNDFSKGLGFQNTVRKP